MAQIEIIPESIQLIRMSDEEYFSDKYKEYISNSKLGLLNPAQDGSIEKFEAGIENSYSSSFELGSAVHCMLLQPDDFFVSDLDKPTGKLGMFVEEVLKARRKGKSILDSINIAKVKANYYANSLTTNRIKTAIKKSLKYYLERNKIFEHDLVKQPIFLPKSIKTTFDLCIESINKSKDFLNKINPDYLVTPNESFNEYAIFCDVKVTLDDDTEHTVKIKGKLDNFTLDHEMEVLTLNDVKTTGRPVSYFMGNYIDKVNESGEEEKVWISGSFQKYHYYRQMGLYLWLLSAAVKQLFGYNYELKANMLIVETIPEYNTRICKVNGTHISNGLEEFKELLIYLVKYEQSKRGNRSSEGDGL